MSEEIDPKKMSTPPENPKLWEEYFLHVCSTRLALTSAKEKEQWEAASLIGRVLSHSTTSIQLLELQVILKNPAVIPIPHPFSPRIIRFKEEISKFISVLD